MYWVRPRGSSDGTTIPPSRHFRATAAITACSFWRLNRRRTCAISDSQWGQSGGGQARTHWPMRAGQTPVRQEHGAAPLSWQLCRVPDDPDDASLLHRMADCAVCATDASGFSEMMPLDNTPQWQVSRCVRWEIFSIENSLSRRPETRLPTSTGRPTNYYNLLIDTPVQNDDASYLQGGPVHTRLTFDGGNSIGDASQDYQEETKQQQNHGTAAGLNNHQLAGHLTTAAVIGRAGIQLQPVSSPLESSGLVVDGGGGSNSVATLNFWTSDELKSGSQPAAAATSNTATRSSTKYWTTTNPERTTTAGKHSARRNNAEEAAAARQQPQPRFLAPVRTETGAEIIANDLILSHLDLSSGVDCSAMETYCNLEPVCPLERAAAGNSRRPLSSSTRTIGHEQRPGHESRWQAISSATSSFKPAPISARYLESTVLLRVSSLAEPGGTGSRSVSPKRAGPARSDPGTTATICSKELQGHVPARQRQREDPHRREALQLPHLQQVLQAEKAHLAKHYETHVVPKNGQPSQAGQPSSTVTSSEQQQQQQAAANSNSRISSHSSSNGNTAGPNQRLRHLRGGHHQTPSPRPIQRTSRQLVMYSERRLSSTDRGGCSDKPRLRKNFISHVAPRFLGCCGYKNASFYPFFLMISTNEAPQCNRVLVNVQFVYKMEDNSKLLLL
ncbi:unnamed protein product [Trichogramma brassicae]|uniref:Uncharacterized protein n=1 Tax=Trichogramma brassicae TaxID=86971 RepID=A0A6H5HV93_9HYME|nr:unnamed protein product [Trichogramma brassicae]